jgi:hypothetical protein
VGEGLVVRMLRLSAVLASTVSALSLSCPASAAEPAFEMDIDHKAVLVDGGQVAVLEVAATCPAGAELLESFVYVNQDGFSTQWGTVNVPCDGMPHTRTVRAATLDFVLHKGKASASGYMLLTSGESISPGQRLHLKPAR